MPFPWDKQANKEVSSIDKQTLLDYQKDLLNAVKTGLNSQDKEVYKPNQSKI